MWFNAIGLYGHVTGDVVKLRFGAGTRKRLDHFLLTRFPDGGHTSFPLFNSLSLLSRPPCLVKINLNSLLPSDENIVRQFQTCLSRKFCFTDPTYSLSISHQMILLALAKTEKIRGHSSINTQHTTKKFIRLLPPTTLLPRGETLLPTALT